MKRNIELHIEELVLHGFAPGNRHAIGEAVELELTRLFNEQGMLPSFEKNARIESLKGGEFNVAQGAQAETIGTQIARAIYKGIANENQISSTRTI